MISTTKVHEDVLHNAGNVPRHLKYVIIIISVSKL